MKRGLESVISDGDRLAQVWGESPAFSMGEQTVEQLKTELEKLRALKRSRDEARVRLSKLVDDTSDQMKLVDGIVVRGRSGMKAAFGPDSAQYAQVGGTRESQRKPALRKPKAPKQ